MKIKFLGHASFLITTNNNIKIITDPYKSGAYNGAVGYKPITEEAHIVTISHEHDDHNYYKEIKGTPEIVRGAGEKELFGIKFIGIETYHDLSKGKERGKNVIFLIIADDLKLLHLGDLGHQIKEGEKRKIGDVDILFVPVGGYFTIDAEEASEIVEFLKPRITIPMHFKTPVLDFPIAPVEDFLVEKKNVKMLDVSEIEVSKENLPKEREIWVLKPALI
ncbi:MAG: MBL fold metallo-hydrolase [candidate division WOR-3 bacterium]|uniref:MBL fold metallo-hydrolase n=1 Tax=candidate division WOR-3 bacterium TaxID=2052148 RepID=A0A7V4CIH0_UNCW3